MEKKEREVVRRMEKKEREVVRRRIERKEGERMPLPPSSVILLTPALLPSSHSSSLLLSLIPIHPLHYLSPSFLSVILIIYLPPSSQSSSPPLHPSFLSIRHLITSLLFPVILSRGSEEEERGRRERGSEEDGEEEREVVRRRRERKEGERGSEDD
jgi:hypothetical protein